MHLPTYQIVPLMDAIRAALRDVVMPGEQIIWRDAFRWKDDNGHVIPNHFEGASLQSLAEEFGYEIVHDFCHIGVVKPKRRDA